MGCSGGAFKMLQTREWAYTSRRRVMYTERQIFCYLTFEASYFTE